MTSRDAILEALGRVIDPELRRDLVSLRMVREIELTPDGDVVVGVALTVPGCPLKAKIEGDVRREVGALDGVRSVAVRFTHMTPEERAELTRDAAAATAPARERRGQVRSPSTRARASSPSPPARAASASRR